MVKPAARQTVKFNLCTIIITYNDEYREFRVAFKGAKKDEGYFTNDEEDAKDTAWAMARGGR